MRVENYKGTVGDQPINAQVVRHEDPQEQRVLPPQESLIERLLRQLNSQNTVPVGQLPIYDKGICYATQVLRPSFS